MPRHAYNNDVDGDKRRLSGDYMSSVWIHPVVIRPE
jgi:hypothetical protein